MAGVAQQTAGISAGAVNGARVAYEMHSSTSQEVSKPPPMASQAPTYTYLTTFAFTEHCLIEIAARKPTPEHWWKFTNTSE